jgi:type IV pilus assembly protein PilA
MIQNNRGFTIIELLTVVGIISILASIAIMPFMSMRAKGADSVAVSDARNLVVSANEAFIGRNYPDYSIVNGRKIGLKPDGTYAFTLSEGVKILAFSSAMNAGIGNGELEAYLYHESGTPTSNAMGKRIFYIVVNEDTEVISAPTEM